MTELSSDVQRDLTNGIRAEAIAASAFFMEVVDSIIADYTQIITYSDPAEGELREKAYYMIRGLREALTVVESRINTKLQLELQLNNTDE